MYTPPLAYLLLSPCTKIIKNKHVFILVLGPAKLTMRCERAARSGEQVEGEAGERHEGSREGKKADKLKVHINSLEKMEADYKRYVPLHLLLLPLHFTHCCVRLQACLIEEEDARRAADNAIKKTVAHLNKARSDIHFNEQDLCWYPLSPFPLLCLSFPLLFLSLLLSSLSSLSPLSPLSSHLSHH